MEYFIYHEDYSLDWPGHVFPGHKYEIIYNRLVQEKIITGQNRLQPQPATLAEVQLVHEQSYLKRLDSIALKDPMLGIAECEAPVSQAVLNTFYLATGGTILACEKAIVEKTGTMNLQGGFHHAFPAHGEGFCLINDLAIAIRVMQDRGLAKRAMVIDCDLHQGNGTAFIFKDDPAVFTFSIHQENNYPVKQKSHLDIGLDDFVGDKKYLEHLHRHIPAIIGQHRPELVVYQAGADPYRDDQLGTLKMTKDGLAERDRFIFRTVKAAAIPIAITLGGGYAKQMDDLVDIHCQTARAFKETFG